MRKTKSEKGDRENEWEERDEEGEGRKTKSERGERRSERREESSRFATRLQKEDVRLMLEREVSAI